VDVPLDGFRSVGGPNWLIFEGLLLVNRKQSLSNVFPPVLPDRY
jgi:hypothetical protein